MGRVGVRGGNLRGGSAPSARRPQNFAVLGAAACPVRRADPGGGWGGDAGRGGGIHLPSLRHSLQAGGGLTIMELKANAPTGPLATAWTRHKFEMKLVNPANKRKFNVIVVGSGLAGASAAAALAELGYQVKCFCFQDSPRRAHSIAAQGGINAAKNYQNDGDSVYRLFYDTIKGGDFRAREANV